VIHCVEYLHKRMLTADLFRSFVAMKIEETVFSAYRRHYNKLSTEITEKPISPGAHARISFMSNSSLEEGGAPRDQDSLDY